MSGYALDLTLTVNGERISERVDARKTLVDFLREDLALTGSHVGCEHGVCGACTVRVDGEIVRGCLMLAAQCDGATVDTIEGMSIPAKSPICRRRSSSGTPCSAATALRACSQPRRISSNVALSRAVTTFASIYPATTAAAPATTPSSTQWKRWRRRARKGGRS